MVSSASEVQAVTQTYHLCRCFPPQLAKKMQKKVCSEWRMAPALLSISAIIVAIVASLAWNSPYLCLAYAPGGLGSLYLLFLVKDVKHLKTYAENNKIYIDNNQSLKQSLETLENENKDLRTQLNCFTKQNEKLRESTETLKSLASNLQQENFDLNTANQTLKTTVIELQELQNTLGKTAGTHMQHLNGLQTALQKILDSAGKDVKSFETNLDVFVDETSQLKEMISELKQGGEKYEKATTKIEEEMKSQLHSLFEAANLLQEIFKRFKEWKDEGFAQSQITLQQFLRADIEEKQKQNEVLEQHNEHLRLEIETAKQQYSLFNGIIQTQTNHLQEQKEQIRKLNETREGFDKIFNFFVKHSEEMGNLKQEISEEVKKVLGEYKKMKENLEASSHFGIHFSKPETEHV